jgi:hypothetical protein
MRGAITSFLHMSLRLILLSIGTTLPLPYLHTSWCGTELSKGKAIPATGHGGPQGCETSRLPHFLDNRLTDGGEVFSLTCRPLPPGRFLVFISVRGWKD